ncbi:hypothetical protein [Qaidamihabitans albus]|uniref:hypothetical protein n=1 Tax=Qaidamihabitans albus TaxID=2795733 RepID=UPI0018F123CB|nr:hypothetical protein [Qaidamihabitans albus]
MNELVPLWRRALAAEICWLDGAGEPAALAVTPLLAGDVPCVALPYARAGEVASLHEAARVAFAVTDSRSLPGGGPGRAWIGSAGRTEDSEGDFFAVELLRQELLKYPPSRALADSPLLCRENWWWLPRIVIRLERPVREVELPPRTNPRRHALLVRERDGELSLDTAEIPESPEIRPSQVVLRRPDGGDLRGDGAGAMALGYDYSMPDLERWETWSLRGRLLGDRLDVTERHGDPDAELGPLPLLERIRRQRALSRGCRRGLAGTREQEKRR